MSKRATSALDAASEAVKEKLHAKLNAITAMRRLVAHSKSVKGLQHILSHWLYEPATIRADYDQDADKVLLKAIAASRALDDLAFALHEYEVFHTENDTTSDLQRLGNLISENVARQEEQS